MKYLLFGHKGWIGNKIIIELNKLGIKYNLGNSRLDNLEELENEIKENSYTHIISTVGRTHGKINNKEYTTIDYLEQKGKIVENIRDNLFSPLNLAFLCQKYNIHLTYLGTGCIFKYDNDHPFGKEINGFKESDKPNFFGSEYSVVKGYTDQLMNFFKDIVLNVRIRMPITSCSSKRNFITKITTYEKICSIPNSMTVLDELLPIMIDMSRKKQTGTINLVNPGLITHNEILEMYKEIINPNFTYKNFTLEEQSKILAADRSNNYLDTSKLEKLYPNVLKIKDSVRNILLKMKSK